MDAMVFEDVGWRVVLRETFVRGFSGWEMGRDAGGVEGLADAWWRARERVDG